MREILFRGKRIDNGEWVEGDVHKNIDFSKAHIHPNGERVRSFEIIPETVGQFTGLIVSNVRVFEGDFLKSRGRIFEVFWNEEAFQWQAKQAGTDLEIYRTYHGCHDYFWTITDLGWFVSEEIITGKMTTEIIGNKWDNPEIVENNRNRKSDYFRCMEEHECLDCDERCSTYGDCYFCDNEPLDYCKNCFYEYRKDGVDDE